MGDLVDEPPEDMSPSKARSTLTDEVVALQRKVSSLLVLRGGDTRRAQLDDLRRELQERQDDLRVLDSMYDTSVRVVPRQNVASLGAQPQDGGNTYHYARLPSDLPKFRGSGSNADAFIESLSNSLLAHGVGISRWTSALRLSCMEQVDAAWVRENVHDKPWAEASQSFLFRFRDPLYLHCLQTEFYTLRKKSGEKMLAYTAKFERLAHSLGLRDSPSLTPQFIALFLTSELQLFFLSSPEISFSKLLQTAITLDSGLTSATFLPDDKPTTSTRVRPFCQRHGWGGHSTEQCSVILSRSASTPAITTREPL